MSFFKDVVTDMKSMEQKFTGPDYEYYKKIAKPGDLGVSGKGSIGALSDDIGAIISYVEVLVSGSGRGNTPGKPLGNKFVLETGGQCKDYKTDKTVTRSMYINNVPTKKIPLLSNISGMDFPDIRGLVPGIMEDMYSINPLKMFSAFMEGNEPLCAEVNLPVRDVNDNESKQSAYIPISELKDMKDDGIIPDNLVTEEMINSLNDNVDKSKSNDSKETKETFMNFCDALNGYGVNNNWYSNDNKKGNEGVKTNSFKENLCYSLFSIILLYFAIRLIQKWS